MFDLLKKLGLKAVQRRLQAEIAQGGGPWLSAVLPIVRPVVAAEVSRLEGIAIQKVFPGGQAVAIGAQGLATALVAAAADKAE